ncbi:MAG: Mur ligase family protein [Candidatus Beckwithbacteria bacterium]
MKKQKSMIVGVTGSVGKTSCMMAIKAALEDDFKVKVSAKANSEIGIPLDILGFKVRNYSVFDWLWVIPMTLVKLLTNFEKYDIYVVEMAVDSPYQPKNMEWLLSIIQPSIGVFLNVFPVHTEAFEKLEGNPVDNIAIEKSKLITSLPKAGWAILNTNDKKVVAFANKTKARVVKVEGCDPTVIVVAVAKIFGIDKRKALGKIKKNLKALPGRMRVIPGIKNTTLIDSSYNASRESMLLGLRALTGSDPVSRSTGRKVAVLGDMRELGDLAQKEHEKVAEKAIKVADVIVLVGPLMKKYFLPKAINLGFDKSKIYWFENTNLALVALREKIIKVNDRILIKASQNTLLFEIIVKGLMKNKKDADTLLCRRGKFWDKKREKI